MAAMDIQSDEPKFSILSHGNCIDGWFCSYIAYMALHTKGPVQFFFLSPNQERTWPKGQELRGTHVLLLDISVPQECRDAWTEQGAVSIMCIDHHASSVCHWPEGQCPINTESCAALQVHSHFYPEVPAPGWLKAIDRIDRWDNVTADDRCIREVLSIIAHKPVRGEIEEAVTLTTKFVQDMNDWQTVSSYLQYGQQILAQKDAQLMNVLQKGTVLTITPQWIATWSLPEDWNNRTIFILDNTDITIDTTEAAHLIFAHQATVDVFINYRKKVHYGKPFPQYLFSGRSREFDITKGTILKGHPSAAGAMILANGKTAVPFVL